MGVRRRTLLLAGGAMAGLATTRCARIQGTGSKAEINLYSSRHYNTDAELYAGFKRLTGIQVNLIEGKADELIERIKAEGKNSPADVFLTVDAGRLWEAAKEGIFAPVDESTLLREKVPAHLRDPENLWFGFSKRARVIFYNRERVKPEQLSGYEDLANPQWKGKILVRSSTNVYNQSLVAALIAVHGKEKTEQWCRGLVANFARSPEGSDTSQIEAVAAGQGDVAIANHYYFARYGKSDDPAKRSVFEKVGLFFPNQKDRGTHVNVSGGGMVKTAPNREGAIQFLEYLVSMAAQTFFAQGNDEYPVVSGTPLDPIVGGFGTFKEDTTVNVSAYGENQAEAVKLMDRAGWV